jgi:hypothetical protein
MSKHKKTTAAKSRQTYIRVMAVAISVLIILCLHSHFDKKQKMLSYSTTQGKVIWLGIPSGIRVGPKEVECRYYVNGKTHQQTFERKIDQLKIGDCLEIKYSRIDPDISEVNYEKGAFICKGG